MHHNCVADRGRTLFIVPAAQPHPALGAVRHFFTIYKFGLLCRPIKPDLVRAATLVFPWLLSRLPCGWISVEAGTAHGKIICTG